MTHKIDKITVDQVLIFHAAIYKSEFDYDRRIEQDFEYLKNFDSIADYGFYMLAILIQEPKFNEMNIETATGILNIFLRNNGYYIDFDDERSNELLLNNIEKISDFKGKDVAPIDQAQVFTSTLKTFRKLSDNRITLYDEVMKNYLRKEVDDE